MICNILSYFLHKNVSGGLQNRHQIFEPLSLWIYEIELNPKIIFPFPFGCHLVYGTIADISSASLIRLAASLIRPSKHHVFWTSETTSIALIKLWIIKYYVYILMVCLASCVLYCFIINSTDLRKPEAIFLCFEIRNSRLSWSIRFHHRGICENHSVKIINCNQCPLHEKILTTLSFKQIIDDGEETKAWQHWSQGFWKNEVLPPFGTSMQKIWGVSLSPGSLRLSNNHWRV